MSIFKRFRSVRAVCVSLLVAAVFTIVSCERDEEPHELTCLQKGTLLGAKLEPGVDRRGADVLRATSVFLFEEDFESVLSDVRSQMRHFTTLNDDNSALTDWFWQFSSLYSEVMIWADKKSTYHGGALRMTDSKGWTTIIITVFIYTATDTLYTSSFRSVKL